MSRAVGNGHRHASMPMLISALIIAHQVAGKASRDAIFLSHFRPSDLPPMVTAAAIAAVIASVAGSRTLVRMGPHRVAPVSFAISGVLQAAEWLLLGHSARVGACIIYLHVVAFGPVLISSFWSLLNESFEPRAAKDSFGTIGGIGTLGGLCGGLLAERVAAWFGASDVVLLLAALHLACAGLSFGLARSPGNRACEQPRETSAVDAVQRYPFLFTLAGLVILASSGAALLDFVFKVQAAETIGRGAALLRFFSIYYTATSLLTFVAQTFLARLSVKRAGLAVTAGILPVSISLGSFAGLLLPAFPVLSAVRALELLVRGGLYRPAYELFYTPLAPIDKRAVKSLIDVGADRAGDAVGSAGVSLMLMLAPGRYGPILALACGVSLIAVALAARLRRGYLHALEKSLLERAIELDPSLVEDSATRSVLMQSVEAHLLRFSEEAPAEHQHGRPEVTGSSDSFLRKAGDLRSGDASRVIPAAAELSPDDCMLAPLVIELLAWDEAMPSAREALQRMGGKIIGMLVDALLDPDRDFVIRRRLPRVLAYLPSQRAVDGLFAALQDTRFEVRFYAGRALYLLLNEHSGLSIPPEHLWAAVNRELSLQRSVWDSHRLLDRRGSQESDWFFDDELLDRADRNLEHLFTLLALLLPVEAVRIAFRALHTNDAQLKGTAFEYLESATPVDTRQVLLPLLEADAENRSHAASGNSPIESLLASTARVNRTLNLQPLGMEAGK